MKKVLYLFALLSGAFHVRGQSAFNLFYDLDTNYVFNLSGQVNENANNYLVRTVGVSPGTHHYTLFVNPATGTVSKERAEDDRFARRYDYLYDTASGQTLYFSFQLFLDDQASHRVLLMTDAQDSLLWTKVLTLPGEYFHEAIDLCAAPDGGYYLLSVFNWGPNTVVHPLITRLNADFEVVWDKEINAVQYGDDVSPAMGVLSNGNVVVSYITGGGSVTYKNWLDCYSPDGALVWSKLNPWPFHQGIKVFDVAPTPDGNFIHHCTREGGVWGSSPEVQKWTPEGDTLWTWSTPYIDSYRYGGYINSLFDVADDGSVYVGGVCGAYVPSEENWDLGVSLWLAGISPQGQAIWQRHFPLLSNDSLTFQLDDGIRTHDKGFLFTGNIRRDYSPLDSTFSDAWILKLDSTGCLLPDCGLIQLPETSTGVGEAPPPAPLVPRWQLCPNPAAAAVNIRFAEETPPTKGRLVVSNAVGRELYRQPLSGMSELVLPAGLWPEGVYFVQVWIGNRLPEVKKLVVKRE